MDTFFREILPPGFTLVKTFGFGVVLCFGLKTGEFLVGMIAGAAANAQRKR